MPWHKRFWPFWLLRPWLKLTFIYSSRTRHKQIDLITIYSGADMIQFRKRCRTQWGQVWKLTLILLSTELLAMSDKMCDIMQINKSSSQASSVRTLAGFFMIEQFFGAKFALIKAGKPWPGNPERIYHILHRAHLLYCCDGCTIFGGKTSLTKLHCGNNTTQWKINQKFFCCGSPSKFAA